MRKCRASTISTKRLFMYQSGLIQPLMYIAHAYAIAASAAPTAMAASVMFISPSACSPMNLPNAIAGQRRADEPGGHRERRRARPAARA